jgi:hypothetical protein
MLAEAPLQVIRPPAEIEGKGRSTKYGLPMQNDSRSNNCKFPFKCAENWESLAKTADPDVRFCDLCHEEVFCCRSDAELVNAITLNRCFVIALDYKPFPRPATTDLPAGA